MSDAEEPSTQDSRPANPLELVTEQQQGNDRTSAEHEARRDEVRTPTKAEILNKLNQMPGAIALGYLPPARANAIRSVFGTMLAHLGEPASVGAAAIADEDVLKVLRQNPEMLKVIEPLLTPEQLALVMREAQRD